MLPDWIELPSPKPFAEIDYMGGAYVLVVDGEVLYSNDDDIYDVYSMASDYNFEFTPAAIEASGSEETWLGLHLPGDNGRMTVMLALNDSERWDMLQNDYYQAVDNVYAFRENPIIETAYDMLDTHPAFWTRRTAEPTWNWENDGHVQGFWFAPSGDGWMMEAGGHTEDMTDKYHDLRLDVYEKTFEDCLLALAHKVDKFFNVDGTEIPNVEYEKSEIELRLEEAIKELE